ncbi:MAG: hypothetical protein KJ064_08060 [Anaerolineae bacterium]|nr:hypothetical protein [Anaerolineae bacterium]
MKLTLWQQFSSNHSSHFTIVAAFPSPDAAQQAAERLLHLLKEIDDWFEQPENAAAKTRRDHYYATAPVSDPEKQISEQYAIPWYSYSLDWIYNRRGIVVSDRFVFIYPGDTWQGAKPLADLLAKFGSQTAIQGYVEDKLEPPRAVNARLLFNIDCLAPDEASAQAMVDELLAYLKATADDPQGNHDAPWTANLPAYSAFSGEVSRVGHEVRFRKAFFSTIPAVYFPMFLAYLKEKGCHMTACTFEVEYQEHPYY